jgi:threonine aldolase
MNLEDIKFALQRRGDQHSSQVKAISLTQPTELGTVYSLEEVRAIADWAHSQGLYLHMDGARLTHAATTLNCDLKTITKECGVDVLSMGGTKNGFLFGETVIFFNEDLAENFKYLRKQAAQLPSKTRYLSCQFERYFQPSKPGSQTPLWQEISSHECELAQYLYDRASEISFLKITRPRQSNAVFVQVPRNLLKVLREKFFFYVWDEQTFECRWMISWDTTKTEIDEFIQVLKQQEIR